jgi:hypothetical protein
MPVELAWKCKHVREEGARSNRALFLGDERIVLCAACWCALQHAALRDVVDEALTRAGRTLLSTVGETATMAKLSAEEREGQDGIWQCPDCGATVPHDDVLRSVTGLGCAR